jgi:hypothetical protein
MTIWGHRDKPIRNLATEGRLGQQKSLLLLLHYPAKKVSSSAWRERIRKVRWKSRSSSPLLRQWKFDPLSPRLQLVVPIKTRLAGGESRVRGATHGPDFKLIRLAGTRLYLKRRSIKLECAGASHSPHPCPSPTADGGFTRLLTLPAGGEGSDLRWLTYHSSNK